MQILILLRHVFHWKDVIMQVWRLSTISRYHAREPCLPKFSMSTPQIWVFKSSVLKNLFILCEHGAKANIGVAKMANYRHAVKRNFLQSYWTSDGLSLYSSQPACEKTHPNQHRERAKIRKTTFSVAEWRQSTAPLGQTNDIRNQSNSEKTMVTK